MKKILIPIIILFSLQSCSILEKRICSSYENDDNYFRSKASAISSTVQLAEEKALLDAKKQIAEDVDIYILDKYSHETFLADPEFEIKLNTARKTMLSDITIVCSKTIPKRDIFKSFVAIEISKETIDKELERRLNEEVQ